MLLAPDLAMLGALFTLAWCLLVFDAPRGLFRDSDTGWHIRNGEAIVSGARVMENRLPRTDPYSFSRMGQEWFAWEWLADAWMGAAHKWDGLRGVAVLYLTAIGACTWLWFRLHWAVGGDFFLACAMTSLMLSTAHLHWLARPHVFGWVFLLAWLLWAEKERARFTGRHAIGIAAFAAVWANAHASFFLLPVVAGLAAAGWRLRPLVWESGGRQDLRRARWFALAAACAAVGTFATPYGWRLHMHVAAYLADVDLLSRVGEFQSFNFQSEGALQIALCLAVGAAGAIACLARRRLDHFLIASLVLWIALRSARGLPLAALIALPIANGAITGTLRAAHGFSARVAAGLRAWLDYSARLRALEAGFRGYAWAPAAAVLAYAVLHAPAFAGRTGFPREEFPVAMAGRVDRLPNDARLLAPDKYGGYLIYRFSGARKVFFDGRSDFYGAAFMKDYIRLVQVRPGWQRQIVEYKFTHALLPVDYSLTAALEQAGWKVLDRDRVSVLLEGPGKGGRPEGGN